MDPSDGHRVTKAQPAPASLRDARRIAPKLCALWALCVSTLSSLCSLCFCGQFFSTRPAMTGLLSKDRIVAGPGFNRWLVPPAALAIHLFIGMAYGVRVLWLP